MRHRLITTRARSLRKAMSPPEVLLWTRLRGRGPDRPTFRRQHPIGTVIVDFYCPSARLAVKVDGATHLEEARSERDAARDIWLERQGVDVVRIPAVEVFRDVAGVADRIFLRAEALRAKPG